MRCHTTPAHTVASTILCGHISNLICPFKCWPGVAETIKSSLLLSATKLTCWYLMGFNFCCLPAHAVTRQPSTLELAVLTFRWSPMCKYIYVCIRKCIRLQQSKLISGVHYRFGWFPTMLRQPNTSRSEQMQRHQNSMLALFRPFFFFSILLFILFSFKQNCYICRRLIYCEDVSAAHIPDHLVAVLRTILLLSLSSMNMSWIAWKAFGGYVIPFYVCEIYEFCSHTTDFNRIFTS